MGDQDFTKGLSSTTREQDFFRRRAKEGGRELEDTRGKAGRLTLLSKKLCRYMKKGTKLTVLQEKLGWLRIQLEDGTEGWVGKALTSEGAQQKSP